MAPGGAHEPSVTQGGVPDAGVKQRADENLSQDTVILSKHEVQVRSGRVSGEQVAMRDQEGDNQMRGGTGPVQPGDTPAEASTGRVLPPGAGTEHAVPESGGGEIEPRPASRAQLVKVGGLAPAGPPPPWRKVLATTLHLWWQRHIVRLIPSRALRRVIGALVLAAIAVAAVAATTGLLKSARQGTGSTTKPGSPHPVIVPDGASAADRQLAATWVAQQVTRRAVVACDPQMCAALARAGIRGQRLRALTTVHPDPRGSTVIVATPAVRSAFAGQLSQRYAPAVLASFGTGKTEVAVRVVAPHGVPAYRAGLLADVQARRSAGKQLLGNNRIHAAGAARKQLAAGEVDSRLLSTLATLAAQYPIDITRFGLGGPGATAGVPFRAADFGPAATSGPGSVPLSSLTAFFRAQQSPYEPAHIVLVRAGSGKQVLRIDFAAPSPVGLLGSQTGLRGTP
jgi:hypothetical protein